MTRALRDTFTFVMNKDNYNQFPEPPEKRSRQLHTSAAGRVAPWGQVREDLSSTDQADPVHEVYN